MKSLYKHNYLVILGLILFLAFLLGAPMILHGDFYYLADQARDMILVRDIVLNHEITLIGTHSGIGGFFHGPIWLYLLTPVYILGKGNPLVFASSYIFLQLLTIVAGYVIGSRLYGRKVGLLISFILGSNPVLWVNVPNTIGINLLPLIFILLFYSLIRFVRGEPKYFIVGSFIAGISLHFEAALPLVLIPTFVIIYTLFSRKKISPRIVFYSTVSYIISISTFIVFDLRHNFLMLRALLSTFSSSQHEKGYLLIKERIPEHVNSLWGVYKGFLFNENSPLLIIAGLIFISGLILLKKKENFKEAMLYLLFPMNIYIFFIFYPYPIFTDYVLGLTIPLVLLFSLCAKEVCKTKWGKLLVILFIFFTFYYEALFIKSSYLNYHPNVSAGSYLNQKEVADWISKDAGGNPFGYFVYTQETFTYGMDYLLWWESKNNNTIAITQKINYTYLIFYPELTGDASAHQFWKRNIVKTSASPVLVKNFPGNISVEKIIPQNNEKAVDPNYFQNLIFR